MAGDDAKLPDAGRSPPCVLGPVAVEAVLAGRGHEERRVLRVVDRFHEFAKLVEARDRLDRVARGRDEVAMGPDLKAALRSRLAPAWGAERLEVLLALLRVSLGARGPEGRERARSEVRARGVDFFAELEEVERRGPLVTSSRARYSLPVQTSMLNVSEASGVAGLGGATEPRLRAARRSPCAAPSERWTARRFGKPSRARGGGSEVEDGGPSNPFLSARARNLQRPSTPLQSTNCG